VRRCRRAVVLRGVIPLAMAIAATPFPIKFVTARAIATANVETISK
jgi:hypothetical protein